MFSRTAAIIVLAASAVFVAAAPTGVDYAPMVTVRDVSGSDAAQSATRSNSFSSPEIGGIAVPLNGITQSISFGPLSNAAGGITHAIGEGIPGRLTRCLTGDKGLGGLGI